MVPVVEHAEGRDLWSLAAEVARLSAAARDGTVTLDELHGSTITITSLGALGGIVSTPVINYPEVAIIGVNKIVTRPVFVDGDVAAAADDEPVVVVRPPRRRRLGRRRSSSSGSRRCSRPRRCCLCKRVRVDGPDSLTQTRVGMA